MAKVRSFVPWVLAAFLVYAVVTSPDSASAAVHNVWDILAQGVDNIGKFFGGVLNGK